MTYINDAIECLDDLVDRYASGIAASLLIAVISAPAIIGFLLGASIWQSIGILSATLYGIMFAIYMESL